MSIKRLLATALLASLHFGAGAADANLAGQRLAASCTACHGTNGAAAPGTLPNLAGQPKATLLASLQAFKAGTRPSTIMQQLSKGYTDEQLDAIAAFFAAQKTQGGAR